MLEAEMIRIIIISSVKLSNLTAFVFVVRVLTKIDNLFLEKCIELKKKMVMKNRNYCC